MSLEASFKMFFLVILKLCDEIARTKTRIHVVMTDCCISYSVDRWVICAILIFIIVTIVMFCLLESDLNFSLTSANLTFFRLSPPSLQKGLISYLVSLRRVPQILSFHQ